MVTEFYRFYIQKQAAGSVFGLRAILLTADQEHKTMKKDTVIGLPLFKSSSLQQKK